MQEYNKQDLQIVPRQERRLKAVVDAVHRVIVMVVAEAAFAEPGIKQLYVFHVTIKSNAS